MLGDQLTGGTDLGDDPVMLQHRAVFDLPPIPAVGGLVDNGAGVDCFRNMQSGPFSESSWNQRVVEWRRISSRN
jgi:hypothetical protein